MSSSTSQPYRYHYKPADHPLGVKLVGAGLAACCADLVTFPLDTAKVRLQIQNRATAEVVTSMSTPVSSSAALLHGRPTLLGTLTGICRSEGPLCLYSGLVAGLHRQLVFSSIRIGLYDDVKARYQHMLNREKGARSSMDVRILSGLTTGAISVSVGQPTDVVKIKMQAQGASGNIVYKRAIHAYGQVARQEGLRGLYKGYLPNVTRNSLTNVAELVTYDVIKEYLLHHNILRDNVWCHMTSGLMAGFIATLIASPVDVVKTRYMSAQPGEYTGAFDCATKMLRANGPLSFYKGFVPSFIRFGSWNIIMFVCYEEARQILTHAYKTDCYTKPHI